MSTIVINVNDTITSSDTIVLKVVQVADTCQTVVSDPNVGWKIGTLFLAIIVIGAVCIYGVCKLFNFKLCFDRLLSRNLFLQFGIVAVFLLILFFMSWLFLDMSGCEWKQFAKDSNVSEWLLPLYLLIDTNAFNNLYINGVNGWALGVSSITFVIGAFIFNGAIIAIITNSIERRVQNHQEGHIHYLKSGHYIIMGYDEMVPSFITHIFEQGKAKKPYVLILSSTEATVIKEKLRTSFSEKQMKQIIINYGHKTSTEDYKEIYLEAAQHVYIVGDHHKPAHDAINVECLDSVYRYLSNPKVTKRPGGITCVFKDLDTYAAFKTSDIFSKMADLGVDFIPYNFYTGWAKQVFVKRKYKDFDNPEVEAYKYPAVYGKGITPDDERYVHLVFVGTTNFAVAFAMEAAHVLHFPNAEKVKTKITFIDKNADKEKEEFIIRNRHFFEIQPFYYYDFTNEKKEKKEKEGVRDEYVRFTGNDVGFLDVEFEFIKGDVFSKKVQDEIENWAKEHNEKQYLSIFLAMTDQRQNFVMGMNMPDAVYEQAVAIFIRQDRSDNFVTNLRNADIKKDDNKFKYWTVNERGQLGIKYCNARYANIYPFGMNETAFSEDNHSLKRAKLINYLYCTMPSDYKFQELTALEEIDPNDIWEKANEEWSRLPVALRWSNLYNSYTIRTKLACLRAMRKLDITDTSHDYEPLSVYEVDELAKVEHNRWNVEKLLMGYRKARANEDKFVHPEYEDDLKMNKKLFIHHDIRPYEGLGDIQKLDCELSRYIPWIMKMTEGNG